MKKLFIAFVVVINTAGVFAQAPEMLSYQAVVRSADGKLVTNQSIGTRISILQGSATGTVVYKEIYNPNPQTNTNGLISLVVGSGVPVTGMFTTINWVAGPYFLKTETDPTGGTNYTIAGTSQLLSVPYALQSKTAEKLTSTYPETDPLFNASAAKGIKSSDIEKWNASTHHIGELYGGGIVFYVYDSGKHGLIVDTVDLSTNVYWYNKTAIINAVRDGIGGGKFNTERIIATQDATDYAAQICSNYQGGNYGDWYLPSKFELNLLYLQKSLIGGFAKANYWSSNGTETVFAWYQNFNSGELGNDSSFTHCYVRAVRTF